MCARRAGELGSLALSEFTRILVGFNVKTWQTSHY